MRNSTTHTAQDDHPSALVHISSGRSRLHIENSANLEKDINLYARQCKVNITNSTLNNNFGADCILCKVKSKVILDDVQYSNGKPWKFQHSLFVENWHKHNG